MKRFGLVLGAIITVAFAAVAAAVPALAADHGDAPLSKANHAEDIADVYAFNGDSGNVVFAMTVNPLSMPGDKPTFDPAGVYQFKIDNDGDAKAEVSYNATFGPVAADGTQSVTVTRSTGTAADTLSTAGTTILSGTTTAPSSSTPNVVTAGSMKLFAGLRDDPFFFDLTAFKASCASGPPCGGVSFRNPGNDFFQGLNVSAIVLSVPSSDFLVSGSTKAGVWAVTSKSGTIIDRMGRPAIATVFIPLTQRDAFNQTAPANDVTTWKSTVQASLTSLGADPALANTLLPDILTFDTSKPLNFLNGRALADDVIDGELQLITGNPAATDNVANDSTFLTGFPYLGVPNTAPAPTPVPVSSPAPAATAAGPAATQPARAGVVAPNTGTGSGSGGDRSLLWVLATLGAVAVTTVVTGVAVRARK